MAKKLEDAENRMQLKEDERPVSYIDDLGTVCHELLTMVNMVVESSQYPSVNDIAMAANS